MAEPPLLDEQLAYYRERAAEYDEWWERRGRYDRGAELNSSWWSEIAVVRAVFDELPLHGSVVELAAGTGYWTELLAARATRVTALDGSPEMIALNKARLHDMASLVDYRVVNLFEWQPDRRWDGMVFCFWISHVPRDRLGAFFHTCRKALQDGAPMFFLDGLRVEERADVDQPVSDQESEVLLRKLKDGRVFRIVKNFYEPEELVQLAKAANISLQVRRTDTYFLFGVGSAC